VVDSFLKLGQRIASISINDGARTIAKKT